MLKLKCVDCRKVTDRHFEFCLNGWADNIILNFV